MSLAQDILNSVKLRLRKDVSTDQSGTNHLTIGATSYNYLADQYSRMMDNTNNRSVIYKDVEAMDDEVVSTVLDMYADDVTQLDYTTNRSIKVSSSDPKATKVLLNMVERLNLEEKIWFYAREIAKYGDFIAKITHAPNTGITNIDDSYLPYEVCRLEKTGKLCGFLVLDSNIRKNPDLSPAQVTDFIHFRRLKYRIIEDLLPSSFYNDWDVDPYPRYGTSTIHSARKTEKKLRLSEDSLTLARLLKSIYYKVHHVEVGNADPSEQSKIIRNYKELFNFSSKVDKNTDTFSSDRNPMSFYQDVFVPVRNASKGSSSIKEFGGDVDITTIADIEFLNNKRFGVLRVPKQYLSFDSSVSYNTLVALDPRYARAVSSIQKTLLIGLTILAQIELKCHGLSFDPSAFSINLVPVSHSSESNKIESLSSTLDMVTKIKDLVSSASDYDPKYLVRYLMDRYLKFSDINYSKLFPSAEGAEVTTEDTPEESLSKDIEYNLDKLVDSVLDENLDIKSVVDVIEGREILGVVSLDKNDASHLFSSDNNFDQKIPERRK